MTTRDLMIGDYVTFKDCQNDDAPTIVKIEGLGYQGRGVVEEALVTINGDKYGFDLVEIDDEFVGIPLTPEILEKNGFAKRPHYEIYALFTDDYELRYYPKQNRVSVSIILEDGIDTREYSTPSNYLHELQHALRLCGINKEIIL